MLAAESCGLLPDVPFKTTLFSLPLLYPPPIRLIVALDLLEDLLAPLPCLQQSLPFSAAFALFVVGPHSLTNKVFYLICCCQGQYPFLADSICVVAKQSKHLVQGSASG